MEILSWLLILFSVAVTITGIVYVFLQTAFAYWKDRNIPYLRPTFPFGNLGDLLLGRKSMGEAYADIYKKMNGLKFGGVYLMHRPQLIVRDPDMIKNCLLKDFECFHDHGFVFDEKIDPLTGNLFMLTGQKWKHLRAVLSPTFSSGKIKIMFTTMVECGQGLAKFLDKYAYCKGYAEIKDIAARFTTDVIASCAFGIQCNCLKYPDSEFRQWGKRMVEQSLIDTCIGLLYIVQPTIPIFFKLPLTSRSVSAFFRKVVRETVEFREKNGVKRNDFLQLLIDLKEQKRLQKDEPDFTMDEMTAQVMVFFTGGFETSSVTMSFCLYELAMNMDIQKSLSTEIDAVLGRYGGNITYEAVKEMKYLDKVVSETLRKYPPLTFLNRHCTKNYRIPGTDLVVEKGVQVVIPVLGLHKDPRYFPDPEKFDPERFGEEYKSGRPNYVYLPFGEGLRICIGFHGGLYEYGCLLGCCTMLFGRSLPTFQMCLLPPSSRQLHGKTTHKTAIFIISGKRFGLMQIKVGLICLISKYEFRVCEKTENRLTIDSRKFIMSPVEGVWLQICYRSDPREN